MNINKPIRLPFIVFREAMPQLVSHKLSHSQGKA